MKKYSVSINVSSSEKEQSYNFEAEDVDGKGLVVTKQEGNANVEHSLQVFENGKKVIDIKNHN